MSILRTNKFQTLSGTTMSNVIQTQMTSTITQLSYTNSNGEFFYGSITPFFNTSKIAILVYFGWDSTNPNGHFSIRRSADNGGSYIVVPGQDAPVNSNGNNGFYGADERMGGQYDIKPVMFCFQDSPGTTGALRYQLFWNHVGQNGGTCYFNQCQTQGNDPSVSTMILMEIAQ